MSKNFDPKKNNTDSQPYDEPEKKHKRNPYQDQNKERPKTFKSPKEAYADAMKNPKDFGKSKDVVFDTSWDLMKFGDCPVCLGDPMACPTPDVPMSSCGTRRNAIKHMMRGKGGRPPITLHR